MILDDHLFIYCNVQNIFIHRYIHVCCSVYTLLLHICYCCKLLCTFLFEPTEWFKHCSTKSGGESHAGVLQELPESVGNVSMAVDPSAVCNEEACCICFESPIREPTRTKCNHWFCWSAPTRLSMLSSQAWLFPDHLSRGYCCGSGYVSGYCYVSG